MIFFRIGSFLLIITCCLHLLGHFSTAPTNEAERQLFETMSSTPLNAGNGETLTMMNLYLGMSLCFSLLFLWSGVLSLVMSYKLKTQTGTLKTFAWINAGALAIGSGIGLIYFFLAPNLCLILCALFFLVAAIRLKKS